MELQHPMHIVSPTVDADVLTVLARAEHEFTIAALERLIERRSGEGIRLALNRLVEQGIVLRKVVGRGHAFRLNRRHLGAPAIVELATLQDLLLQRIRQSLGDWREPPIYASLFGSAARGQMEASSDLDILLVRGRVDSAAWNDQVDRLMAEITAWTGNEARALDVAEDEIRGRMANDSVLADVLRDGIPVHGDPTTLRRLVTAR